MKSLKNKIILMLTTVCLLLGMVGCGQNKPPESAKKIFSKIKT